MLVRVKMIGTGTSRDPFRAPLPEYDEVLTLHDEGIVYAIIPDDTHPNLYEHASAKFKSTGSGKLLISLDDAGHSEWYKHLDERYQEHKGKFRPEIAQ